MAVVQGDVTFKVKVIMDDTEPVLMSLEGMRIDPQSAQKAHRKALRRSRIIAGHSYAYTGSVFEDTTHLPAKGHRWTGLRDYTGPDYVDPDASVLPVTLTGDEISALAALGPGDLRMVDWFGPGGAQAIVRDVDQRIAPERASPALITDKQIEALREEALAACDYVLAATCDGALAGIATNREECARALAGPRPTPSDVAWIMGGGPSSRRRGYREIKAGDPDCPQAPLKPQEPMPVAPSTFASFAEYEACIRNGLTDIEHITRLQGPSPDPAPAPDRLHGEPTLTLVAQSPLIFTPRPGPGESEWRTVDEAHQDLAKAAAEAGKSVEEFSATLRKVWLTANEELASRKSPLMFEFIDARVETDEEHNERIRRAWVSYSFGGKVNGPTLVEHPDGRREMFGGTHENPWASRSTTLPDMVPAAVLARRPPARIPTPTDLDDHFLVDSDESMTGRLPR